MFGLSKPSLFNSPENVFFEDGDYMDLDEKIADDFEDRKRCFKLLKNNTDDERIRRFISKNKNNQICLKNLMSFCSTCCCYEEGKIPIRYMLTHLYFNNFGIGNFGKPTCPEIYKILNNIVEVLVNSKSVESMLANQKKNLSYKSYLDTLNECIDDGYQFTKDGIFCKLFEYDNELVVESVFKIARCYSEFRSFEGYDSCFRVKFKKNNYKLYKNKFYSTIDVEILPRNNQIIDVKVCYGRRN